MNRPRGTIIVMKRYLVGAGGLGLGAKWKNLHGAETYVCIHDPSGHYTIGTTSSWNTSDLDMWEIVDPKEDLFDTLYKRLTK